MKAKDLIKKPLDYETVIKEIEQCNERGQYKHFIPHFMLISDDLKYKLIDSGFKVSKGVWMMSDEGLIIEW